MTAQLNVTARRPVVVAAPTPGRHRITRETPPECKASYMVKSRADILQRLSGSRRNLVGR